MEQEFILSPNEKGPNVETYTLGDKRWLCLWNNSDTQTLYVSLRYDNGGITNFGIEPRGSLGWSSNGGHFTLQVS